MYELSVRTRFAAAHYLREYCGPCARLHGHTWTVEATVRGRELDRGGMLIDFKDLKTKLNEIIEELDHQNLNDLAAFGTDGEGNPTAENLARYIFQSLKNSFQTDAIGASVSRVRVWESPDASATYWEE
ncbi:MAG: 6-carboxytetrahydropterin synthase QueD [Firmicutes bacterium]|nr:6-carboxytetrahydropterin synthase QueD [Bacillota bacterium]